METFAYLFKYSVYVLFTVFQGMMFLRVILSWFDRTCQWTVSRFILRLTEPLVFPMRWVCYKLNLFQQSMIDIPFLFTYLLLSLLQLLVVVSL